VASEGSPLPPTNLGAIRVLWTLPGLWTRRAHTPWKPQNGFHKRPQDITTTHDLGRTNAQTGDV